MANNDAKLLLELAQMRMWDKVDEAFTWMYTQFHINDYIQFKDRYPRGSAERRKFTTVCNFFELAGVFVLRGHLSEDLFFDMGFGLDIMWSKVKGIMPGFRNDTSPRMYENFELLYLKHEEWLKKNPPKLSKKPV